MSCGWIRTGVDKPIATTGSRTRLNIVDAITKQYATVNSESIINFFKWIKEPYVTGKAIHLILDGAMYHSRDVVKIQAEKFGVILHH